MRYRGSPEAGFTLLELLVALAALGLLTVMMAGGLRFGARVWRWQRASTDDASAVLAGREAMIRLLSRFEPVYASPSPADATLAFEGGEDTVRFSAPMRSVSGAVLVTSFVLQARREEAGGRLVLGWEPGLSDPMPSETDWSRETVLDGVSGVHFRYYGQGMQDEAPAWHAAWAGERTLPALIEVAVDRPVGLQPVRFTVAPLLSHDEACRYDPIGPACDRPR